MSKKLFLLISFVVVLGLVGSAAADKTWLGTDTNWFNADNWAPAGVPERGWDEYSGDIVKIDGGKPNYPIISTTDPCACCKKLWLGSVAGTGDAYLTIEDGGELTIRSYETGTGNQTIVLGKALGTHGILNMNGGTINMTAGEQFEIGGRGNAGDGTFNMTGGLLKNGDIALAGYGASGTGTLNLDGGVIDCNDYTMTNSYFGTLNVYSGSFITDYLGCRDGHHINLYGGEIHSWTWNMWTGFGVFDIYDGVWYNYTQGDPGTNWTTYWARGYINNDQITAYGGRGTALVEWTDMTHPDANFVIPEWQLEDLMPDPNGQIRWWVRADFNPNIAYWPNPDDGFAGASPDQTLHWTPAYTGNATHHDVYFGTNYDDVNNASVGDDPCGVYIGRREPNSITRVEYNPPEILVMGVPYYWRIDEVNETDPCSPWKGTVWSFSINYVEIEGFETYTSTPDLKSSWVPGHAFHYVALETTTAASGTQSLKLYPYSVTAESIGSGEVTYTFAEDQDWSPTATAARILGLSYLGDAGNPVDNGDKIYVKLKDSLDNEATQWLNDDNAIGVTSWSEVLFSLKGFDGVDLSKVKTITLGIGQDPPKNTSVMFLFVWFDDLKLYLPLCDTSYLQAPGDINGNCVTDFDDLDILVETGSWLVSNWDIEVTAPAVGPVLHYEFEGNANDSSGNGYHGEVNDINEAEYVAGYDGQALVFDGNAIDATGVDVPLGSLSTIDRKVTVAFWMYSDETSGSRTLFDGSLAGGEYGDRTLYLMFTGDTSAQAAFGNDGNNIDTLSGSAGTIAGQWTHWAITKNCDANEMRIYVNGELLASEVYHGSGDKNIPIANIVEFRLGENIRGDDVYTGLIDDFRLYDYALTQGEICNLAGETVGTTFIQPLQRLLVTGYDINLNDDGVLDVIDFKDFAVLADTWLQTWTFGDYPDEIY